MEETMKRLANAALGMTFVLLGCADKISNTGVVELTGPDPGAPSTLFDAAAIR